MGDINCRDAIDQLYDFLDGELTEERMQEMREHLDRCSGCHPHYDFERAFLAAVAASRERGGCPAAVRQRVMESLRAAGLQK